MLLVRTIRRFVNNLYFFCFGSVISIGTNAKFVSDLVVSANKASYEQPAILARKTGNYLLAEELLKKLDYSSRPTPGKLLALSLERAKIVSIFIII